MKNIWQTSKHSSITLLPAMKTLTSKWLTYPPSSTTNSRCNKPNSKLRVEPFLHTSPIQPPSNYWGWHALMLPYHCLPGTEPQPPSIPDPSVTTFPHTAFDISLTPQTLPTSALPLSHRCCGTGWCNPYQPKPHSHLKQIPCSLSLHNLLLNQPLLPSRKFTILCYTNQYCVSTCPTIHGETQYRKTCPLTSFVSSEKCEYHQPCQWLHWMASGCPCTLPLFCGDHLFASDKHPMDPTLGQSNLANLSQASHMPGKIATSNSKAVTLGNYQPGGMSTLSIGKWVSCARIADQDQSGLGHWSYIEFEGHDAHQIRIALAYQSCIQNTWLSSNTYHDQQYQLLLESGQSQPDPWLQFLDDFIHHICTWQTQHKAMLICMDASDDVTWLNPKKGIGCLIAETNLIDLHQNSHPNLMHPLHTTEANLPLISVLVLLSLSQHSRKVWSYHLAFQSTYQAITGPWY